MKVPNLFDSEVRLSGKGTRGAVRSWDVGRLTCILLPSIKVRLCTINIKRGTHVEVDPTALL